MLVREIVANYGIVGISLYNGPFYLIWRQPSARMKLKMCKVGAGAADDGT